MAVVGCVAHLWEEEADGDFGTGSGINVAGVLGIGINSWHRDAQHGDDWWHRNSGTGSHGGGAR